MMQPVWFAGQTLSNDECCDVNTRLQRPSYLLVIVLQVISEVTLINGCNNPWITAVPIRGRASNLGPNEEEQRANRNVKPKPVSAEPLESEDPSAGGWAGYLQQIRYAIASARSYHVSPAPGWSW
jgi:hypothetical protein